MAGNITGQGTAWSTLLVQRGCSG